jgi:hypothetical protein
MEMQWHYHRRVLVVHTICAQKQNVRESEVLGVAEILTRYGSTESDLQTTTVPTNIQMH